MLAQVTTLIATLYEMHDSDALERRKREFVTFSVLWVVFLAL